MHAWTRIRELSPPPPYLISGGNGIWATDHWRKIDNYCTSSISFFFIAYRKNVIGTKWEQS
jgi:hypothetical protein